MNRLEAFEQLRRMGTAVFRTGEAAAVLQEVDSTAHSTLAVLAQHGLIVPLRYGWWVLPAAGHVDAGSLAPHIAAPYAGYVSFETALFRHGWITQIPPRVTVATLGRSRRIPTNVGTFELRRIPPDVFGPGEVEPERPWLAMPEKAAFDWAYQAARGGFESARFPEIDPTDEADAAALGAFIANIPETRRRITTARILRERMALPVNGDITVAPAGQRARNLPDPNAIAIDDIEVETFSGQL